MSPEERKSLLSQPLEHLIFTDWFIEQARLMNFDTLQDIVYIKERDLMKKAGFNQVWYMELIGFFYKRDMLDILESERRF